MYAGQILFYDGPDKLNEVLNGTEAFSIFRLDTSRVLFLFPLHIDADWNMPCDAVLEFLPFFIIDPICFIDYVILGY